MRKTLTIAFLLMIALLVPVGSDAQQNVSFGTFQIDLWPEYDRPEMLVIYGATLSPDVQLPAALTFRIPAAAGAPSAVAEGAEGETLMNVEYTREIQGEWALIRFTATARVVQLEYYDPALEKNGVERTFVYHWPGDYDVDQLIMFVQQPTGADSMLISPRLSEIQQKPNGILFQWAEIGSLKANESFELTVNYQKESDALTVEFLPIQPSAPVTTDTPGRVSIGNIIPWGIGLLGVIITVAGFYWYWATGRKETKRSGTRHRATASGRRKNVGAPSKSDDPFGSLGISDKHEQDDGVFCHQCGKRAASGDKFCRACGTKLRATARGRP